MSCPYYSVTTSRLVIAILTICLLGMPQISANAQEDGSVASDENLKTQRPSGAASRDVETYDLWTAKYLTGDWGGIRSSLEEQGISIILNSHTQFMVNTRGGLETKNGNDFAASYNLELVFDLQKMGLVSGAEFVFESKGTSGGEISDFDKEKVGGLFKTNADAKEEEPIFVDKWWWHQKLLNDRIELRVGRIETEKDLFDVNSVAGHEDKQFLNKALVANPTIPHKLGMGAYLKFRPTDWLYVQAAVMDPEARDRRTGFDTAFHGTDRVQFFWELGVTPEFGSAKGKLGGRYLVGSWYNPGPKEVFFDTLDGRRARRYRNDDVGFYFGFEQLVWKENRDPEDTQGLTIFGRYGYAHDDTDMIEHFWSAGGQYAGLLPSREDDVIGFGVAQAILSEQYHKEIDPAADRETVYELYYAWHATPWCIISPDLQYVANPGGDKDDRDAVVAGVRLRVSF
ncbi:MAG: carbohydrate porin [Phycisphaerales bacterium]|nr:MAG: carbohydrate porin [Phycisphaerales bacterium]